MDRLGKVTRAVVCSALVLTGCGSGGGGGSVQGPNDEPGDVESLSFMPIAGDWFGEASEPALGNRFWIQIRLDDSAAPEERIGQVAYGLFGSLENPLCSGHWHAVAVNARVYTVTERINRGAALGGCVDGTVVLEHDPSDRTLDYEFSPLNGDPQLFATGLLRPHVDTGPFPTAGLAP